MNLWLFGSLTFFIIWFFIFIFVKRIRKEMFFSSLFTLPLGLTEPLFVPEYWNPPSLFNLASRTGFDIESLIFTFSIGGIAAIIYEIFFKIKHKKISSNARKKHKFHLLALLSTPIIFLLLYIFTRLNPIYSAIIAIFIGGIATLICRPDLKNKAIFSGFLFLFFYFLLFSLINLISQDWVKNVWNLESISGILLLGIPIEELFFAFGVGLMWSNIYEHVRWYKLIEDKKN